MYIVYRTTADGSKYASAAVSKRAAAFFRVRGCGQREDGGGVFGALRPHGYRAGGDAYGRKFVQVGYRSGVEGVECLSAF